MAPPVVRYRPVTPTGAVLTARSLEESGLVGLALGAWRRARWVLVHSDCPPELVSAVDARIAALEAGQ